ncbi:MAG TPA: hypothetical protein VMZ69_11545, partial [Saprospiraceae bacterium]|nr:hypothetical protein [Saprospiraceae bacterium]
SIDRPLGKKPKDPPPPPPQVYFYFDNCTYPTTTGNFVVGQPTNATFLMHYINSPGGNYPAFTSSTVSGVTISTPAGTLNVGSGNILYTASGIPTTSGFHNVSIGINYGGFINCSLAIEIQNAPPQGGNCSDPGPTEGSTGCVTFIYRGQEVTYQTVRAADGKIWLQSNLGSPYVAFAAHNVGAFGHFFQWGRWDDGHQVQTSPSITGSSTLQNPSHIPNGNPNFIKGSTASTSWWGIGGTSTDTWSSAPPSSTNGFDPGTALGAGWHIPTASDWNTIIISEDIFDTNSAFASNLKLTDAGLRYSQDGLLYTSWNGGNYWSNTASGINAKWFHFDEVYNGLLQDAGRGNGANLRLVKN